MLRSIEGRAPVVNAKPVRTRDFSVEVQCSGPAVLPAVYKNFHLVTLFLSDDSIVGRKGAGGAGGLIWTRFSAGDSSIRPAGPGDRVEWPEGVHCLYVHLHPRLIRRVGESLYGVARLALETRRRLRDPVIREIGLQLNHAITMSSIHARNVHELVTALAHHVTHRYSVDAPPAVRIGRLHLEDVLDQLRDAVDSWDGVTSMAERAGLTRSHFSRRVRALAGLSPYAMVRASRIEAAKHLLEQTSMSLSDVAYRTGFADQSHLTRVFRRMTELTPAGYRAHRSAARHE